MQAFFQSVTNSLKEQFGHPVKLIELLERQPKVIVPLRSPRRSIAVRSIVCWHQLNEPEYGQWPVRKPGDLQGWKFDPLDAKLYHGRGYSTFILNRQEYSQIGQSKITNDWACEITEIDGFLDSKSDLLRYGTTDEMVEVNSQPYIDAITPEKLAENLAHDEIRIIHAPGSDYFFRHSWDGRVFLMNSGGSHHLAAAKYIAARLPASVVVRGKLYEHSLNSQAIASLCRDFEMFVVSDDPSVSHAFFTALEAFRATWFYHPMPKPYENVKAILLPRMERKSMKVAQLLRTAGATDLGDHLTQLAAKPITSSAIEI